ncbi:transcriptional regulator [Actinoplanes cyaneus]|uniref:Transcriptional regulator n=1 Tax=Actinoplanes cyaneus TaxID=52696 RepID=A0A919IL58_9ACTN|nr:helix-turn-helix transcriptional regulator [Actinoplanes cyaneus]MCW2139822.1 Helix-turn-helix domain-containing protein [Actinoplanes cyaneus]GID67889.1 transcriptional regulator [Actinoplanes cyaneus]
MDQLGVALRAWRDRLDPATAGLAHHSPRRVPGLRREELAVLAGISAEYVVRLEQGRAPIPSAQVCSALARALRLSDSEQAHLMRLAGHATGSDRVPRVIPGSLYRIMDQLAGHPLAVYDAAWRLLHWNPLFAATFGDPTVRGAGARNALLMHFEDGLSRVRQTTEERAAFEESMVSDLRAATGRYPHDPELAALVTRLNRIHRFRELWQRGDVAEHQGAHKIVEHPEVGDIALDCDVLTTQGSHLHLIVYTPRAGTDARGKLDLLATIGTQQMSAPR